MTYDTLTFAGREMCLLDWGMVLSSVQGRKASSSNDEFSFTLVGRSIADEATTPTFPFEAPIIVRTNRSMVEGVVNGTFQGNPVCWGDTLVEKSIIKFQGKRIGQPLKAGGHGQGVTYKFQGPWYDLQSTHYQQTFASGNNKCVLAEVVLFSYVKGINTDGTEWTLGNISAGDQIQEVLQWLLDQYAAQGFPAPFQYVGHDAGSSPTQRYDAANNVFYSWPVTGTPTISKSLFSLYLPTLTEKPKKCADYITKCLGLSPRASVWFDYSTIPPTFHVTMPDDKRKVTLPLLDGKGHKSISIQRRDDLILRGVVINYRTTNTTDYGDGKGPQTQIVYNTDVWGPREEYGNSYPTTPITGLRVLNELIDYQGVSTTYIQGKIDSEPLNCFNSTHALRRAWWASKRGGEQSKWADLRIRFQDKVYSATSIPDPIITETINGVEKTWTIDQLVAAGFITSGGDPSIYRLVEGTVADWMMIKTHGIGFDVPIIAKKLKFSTSPQYAEYDLVGSSETDGPTLLGGHGTRLSLAAEAGHTTHANLILTNAPSGTYKATASVTGGTEVCFLGNGGIAQYLWRHMKEFQYDGDSVYVAAAFNGLGASGVDLGCAFNLSNGAVEWQNMNAQIQSIVEEYSTHTTSVTIGVAETLSADQLSSLLQMWRWRRNWYNPRIRSNSSTNAGGSQTVASSTGQANTTEGTKPTATAQFVDYDTPPDGQHAGGGTVKGAINNDPKLVTDLVAGNNPASTGGDIKTIQPREVAMTCSNGNMGYAAAMVGEVYTKPST